MQAKTDRYSSFYDDEHLNANMILAVYWKYEHTSDFHSSSLERKKDFAHMNNNYVWVNFCWNITCSLKCPLNILVGSCQSFGNNV